METLSSRNPRVQQLRRLVRQRKVRDQAGLFVLEGAGLLAEALACGVGPVEVFVGDPDALRAPTAADLADTDASLWALDPSVLESIASTTSPQPVLSTVAMVHAPLREAVHDAASFVVVGAGIREPGNAGTLIRTAAAAGADTVVFCDGSVDLYNPKVVRSSAGALFRIPVVRDASLDELWTVLGDHEITSFGLAGSATMPYDALNLTSKLALFVGNEVHGLSERVSTGLDQLATIPMAAGVESLNVSAAGAAVCFEISRQRRSHEIQPGV